MAEPQSAPEFRIMRSQRQDFLSKVSEAVRPYQFLAVERSEGEELVITIFLASDSPGVKAQLGAVSAQLEVASYLAGEADREQEF